MTARQQRLGDPALAVVVLLLSLGLLAAGGRSALDAATLSLAALTALPLAVWRRAPLAVFVLTGLASVALRVVAEPAGPPLGPTVALYFLAAAPGVTRGRVRLILALAVVLVVAHAAAFVLHGDGFAGTPIAFGVLVWGGAWIAGDRARLRQARMVDLEERAARAEREAERERRLATAEERARIARDLHDSAGHAINVILVHAGLGRLRAGRDAAARETFATIEEVARQTVADIDGLVAALREEASDRAVEPPAGLAALETLAERHRAGGLLVTTGFRGPRRPLPPAVDRAAYRILQEALTNAARHGAGRADVQIVFGGETLEIDVSNPVGSGGAADPPRGGHGLVGMHERAALLDGSVDATRRNGHFHVRARLPLGPRSE
jgi:signal transduction histidine kinase